jgi:hypothetical protein
MPEAYAIEKDGHYYYAFFASDDAKTMPKKAAAGKDWKGEVELRGLPAKSFHVTDYVHNKDYGTVSGPTAKLAVEFKDNLLLEAAPNQ